MPEKDTEGVDKALELGTIEIPMTSPETWVEWLNRQVWKKTELTAEEKVAKSFETKRNVVLNKVYKTDLAETKNRLNICTRIEEKYEISLRKTLDQRKAVPADQWISQGFNEQESQVQSNGHLCEALRCYEPEVTSLNSKSLSKFNSYGSGKDRLVNKLKIELTALRNENKEIDQRLMACNRSINDYNFDYNQCKKEMSDCDRVRDSYVEAVTSTEAKLRAEYETRIEQLYSESGKNMASLEQLLGSQKQEILKLSEALELFRSLSPAQKWVESLGETGLNFYAPPKGTLYWAYAIDRLRGKSLLSKVFLFYVSAIDLSLNPVFWNGVERAWMAKIIVVPFSFYITIQVTIWLVKLVGKIVEALRKLIVYLYQEEREEFLKTKNSRGGVKKKIEEIGKRFKFLRGGEKKKLRLEKNLNQALMELETIIQDPVQILIFIESSKQKFFSGYFKIEEISKNYEPVRLKFRHKLMIGFLMLTSFNSIPSGTNFLISNKPTVVRTVRRKSITAENEELISNELENELESELDNELEIKSGESASLIELKKNQAEFESSIGIHTYKLNTYSEDTYESAEENAQKMIEKEIFRHNKNERLQKISERLQKEAKKRRNQVQNFNKFLRESDSDEINHISDEINEIPQKKKVGIKIKNPKNVLKKE